MLELDARETINRLLEPSNVDWEAYPDQIIHTSLLRIMKWKESGQVTQSKHKSEILAEIYIYLDRMGVYLGMHIIPTHPLAEIYCARQDVAR